MIPCSVYLEGEYDLNDICIGVPCIIGANGVESIVDVQLNADEKQKMQDSAEKVKAMNAALSDNL
jgi:malate dehydrogenase